MAHTVIGFSTLLAHCFEMLRYELQAALTVLMVWPVHSTVALHIYDFLFYRRLVVGTCMGASTVSG
jgi:hypothetical protein